MRVAVTGGLSSGKSTVCRLFQELGAHVVSADAIVHQLLSPDHPIGQAVIELTGAEVSPDGQINRGTVAKKVFKNPALLKKLEALLHPTVRTAVDEEFEKAARLNSPPPLFIAEIPLLFETGGNRLYDATIVVVADVKERMHRFQASTGNTEDEFTSRESQQISLEEKARQADYIINNNGDLDKLSKDVKNLFQQLVSKG